LNLTIEDILRLSSFLPVLLYFFFNKEEHKAKHFLFIFFLFVIFHSLIYVIVDQYLPQIFSLLFNAIFIPFEFLIISLFYYNAAENKLYKSFIRNISILFFITLSTRFFISPKINFDSIINGIESIVIIFFSISFFYEQIRTPDKTFIYRDSYFIGICAFFLFFSVSFFVFLFRESYWWLSEFYYQYIYIHALSGILRNLICSIAIIIKPYKEQAIEYS
jgi:hypothetical protein